MSEVRWQGGYEKKARQEEGKVSDDRLIKFLDDLILEDTEEARNYGSDKNDSFQEYIAMLNEIKGKLLDYYDLTERLTNINFPIEAKRKK